MTSNRKNASVQDPIVAAARQRDAMRRIEGDIQPATASAASPAGARAVPPQPTPRAAKPSHKIDEPALPQGRAGRRATTLSTASQTNPSEAGSEISMIRASDLVPERLEYLERPHRTRQAYDGGR